MDLILTRRWIHLGYLMMMHIIVCCESKTRVFPYSRFFALVFKEVGINLSKEIEFEAPSIYDTYNDQPMVRINLRRLQMVLGLEKQRKDKHMDKYTLELKKRHKLGRSRVD